MKYFFGGTLTVIGLLMMLWWGVLALFATLAGISWLGVALVLGGGLMAFSGGLLTADWDAKDAKDSDKKSGARRWPVSKILFSACFIAAIALLLIGLWHIFTLGQIIASVFLVIVGFIGAFAAALAALAQE